MAVVRERFVRSHLFFQITPWRSCRSPRDKNLQAIKMIEFFRGWTEVDEVLEKNDPAEVVTNEVGF